MPGSPILERIRSLDPARAGPQDLRLLVSCLNPNSPHPDCRDAAAGRLEEIAAGSPESAYALHAKLLEIALEMENADRVIGAVDSLVPFLERMKAALAGPTSVRMAEAFLKRAGERRLAPGELREALWLNGLNPRPEADADGTVLDLGSPAALRVEAEFARLLGDAGRADAGDLRELLHDIDPSIRKRARHWLERRGEPGGPRRFVAAGEGLTLEVRPPGGAGPRFRVLGLRKSPVFLLSDDFGEAMDEIVRACEGGEPGGTKSVAVSREGDAVAARWKAAGETWRLRPAAGGGDVAIEQGSLRGVIDYYFGSP